LIIFVDQIYASRFQASDRLGALFGVSILEDNARAQWVWYVVYQMSGMIWKFFTFSFEYISLKKTTRKSSIFYWISDSANPAKGLFYLRYEIFNSYSTNSSRIWADSRWGATLFYYMHKVWIHRLCFSDIFNIFLFCLCFYLRSFGRLFFQKYIFLTVLNFKNSFPNL
jgi:hypothetical protein